MRIKQRGNADNKGKNIKLFSVNWDKILDEFIKLLKEQKEELRFKTFKIWVRNAVTAETISRVIYKKSLRTLFTHFHIFLAHPPTPEEYFLKLINSGAAFGGTMLIDADWFGQEYCLIIYRDYPTGEIIFFR